MEYTREYLESLTRDEVRRLCFSMGLIGYSKKTKGECIEAILSAGSSSRTTRQEERTDQAQTEDDVRLNRLNYNVDSVRLEPGTSNIHSTITVSCGAISSQYDLVGYEVGQIADFLREALNIDLNSTAVVDGRRVDSSYVIRAEDRRLEFIKAAGVKGLY